MAQLGSPVLINWIELIGQENFKKWTNLKEKKIIIGGLDLCIT
jgi:hypothetical protein